MDNNVIDITREVRKAERARKRQKRLERFADWWEDNKVYVMILGPAVVGLLGKGVHIITQHQRTSRERELKDRRCWDASLGHYWELRRKLNNNDWTIINRRRNRGESLGDILDDMNVLK